MKVGLDKLGISDAAYVRGVFRSRIAPQFPAGPRAALMLAGLRQVVLDLVSTDQETHANAVEYLHGNIHLAEVCDVDSVWVRRVLREAGLLQNSAGDKL